MQNQEVINIQSERITFFKIWRSDFGVPYKVPRIILCFPGNIFHVKRPQLSETKKINTNVEFMRGTGVRQPSAPVITVRQAPYRMHSERWLLVRTVVSVLSLSAPCKANHIKTPRTNKLLLFGSLWVIHGRQQQGIAWLQIKHTHTKLQSKP